MAKTIYIGSNKLSIDTTMLNRIESQIKKHYVARVGIMGNKTQREQIQEGETKSKFKKRLKEQKYEVSKATEVTNAEIGMAMEYGVMSKNIPPRSWLEYPLKYRSEKLFGTAKQLIENINKENIELSYKMIGVQAEAIIQEAFATSGWCSWPNPKYREGKPLIDTGQLRRSVSSTVVVK